MYQSHICHGLMQNHRIAYLRSATIPPSEDTRRPISVDESTANVFAPWLSIKLSNLTISSSFAILKTESENITASTDFNSAACDTSFMPIANFASPLFTISITLSSIDDTAASLLELMTSLIAAERRHTNNP